MGQKKKLDDKALHRKNIAKLIPIKRGVNSCVPGGGTPDPFSYMSMASYFSLSGSGQLCYLVYYLILSDVVISLTMDDRNILSGPNVDPLYQ